jgi:hypothetical protein
VSGELVGVSTRFPFLAVVACAMWFSACMKQDIPLPVGPPGEPRLSWSLSAGPWERLHLESACRSDTTAPIPTACAIPRAAGDGKTFVALSIHLFSIGASIRYSGAAITNFFEGGAKAYSAYETNIDYTLRADDPPFNVSITGVLKDDVQNARVTITLFAYRGDSAGDPEHLQVVIPVTFR